MFAIGQSFIVVNVQKIENINNKSGHTASTRQATFYGARFRCLFVHFELKNQFDDSPLQAI